MNALYQKSLYSLKQFMYYVFLLFNLNSNLCSLFLFKIKWFELDETKLGESDQKTLQKDRQGGNEKMFGTKKFNQCPSFCTSSTSETFSSTETGKDHSDHRFRSELNLPSEH